MVKRLRSRMGVLKGVARVNGKVVVEGTMTFALGPASAAATPAARSGVALRCARAECPNTLHTLAPSHTGARRAISPRRLERGSKPSHFQRIAKTCRAARAVALALH